MLTIGSVCSGIGGLELGLEAAGLGPTKWQIEIDPYARAVLAKHWPDAVRHEDLRDAAARPTKLADVNIICGGTPCQDLSLAGRGAGLSGARSGLWFAMLALVTAKRPAFVVWENVPGSIRRGLDVVVSGLCELGYQVVGTRLSAEDLGASHRRERVFIVGHLPDAVREFVREQRGGQRGADGQGPALPGLDGLDGLERPLADAEREGQLQSQGSVGEVGRRPRDGRRPTRAWPAEPNVGRVAHGVPHRTQRDRALGNACTPPQAEVVGWLIRDIADGRVTT